VFFLLLCFRAVDHTKDRPLSGHLSMRSKKISGWHGFPVVPSAGRSFGPTGGWSQGGDVSGELVIRCDLESAKRYFFPQIPRSESRGSPSAAQCSNPRPPQETTSVDVGGRSKGGPAGPWYGRLVFSVFIDAKL